MGQERPEFVVVGHVTCDLTAGGSVPGGAAYYAARAAEGLGIDVGMVTSHGRDFPHGEALASFRTAIRIARESTCFENRYTPEGRIQRLCGLAEPLELRDVPGEFLDARAVYLCPVMGETDLAMASSFRGLVGLGAQGWMRRRGPEGRVLPRRWRPEPALLAPVQVAVLSDEDARWDHGIVDYLREHVPVVVYTHGRQGCEVFAPEGRFEVPAYPTSEVDPTGAGDVFGAVFLVALSRNWSLERAGRLAAAAASIVVEGVGAEALGRISEALDRLRVLERTLGIEEEELPVAW